MTQVLKHQKEPKKSPAIFVEIYNICDDVRILNRMVLGIVKAYFEETANMDSIKDSKRIFEESFEKYGDDPKACLWDQKMVFRYEELTKAVDLNGASVLEIGCGIGGFYDYCIHDKGIANLNYKGIDLVEGMINLAKKKYPSAEFEVCNILEQRLQEMYDYVVLCGVFNVAFDTNDMEKILSQAFQYCKKAMVFNFISTYVNFKDDEISYHDPKEVFCFCAEHLSTKIKMNHHYEKCDVSLCVYR